MSRKRYKKTYFLHNVTPQKLKNLFSRATVKRFRLTISIRFKRLPWGLLISVIEEFLEEFLDQALNSSFNRFRIIRTTRGIKIFFGDWNHFTRKAHDQFQQAQGIADWTRRKRQHCGLLNSRNIHKELIPFPRIACTGACVCPFIALRLRVAYGSDG